LNGTIYEALAVRTDRMAKQALRDVASLSSWKQQRPRRIEEYRQSLGLDLVGPLGVPTIRNYEEFRGRGFYCRKFAFELLPDCWGAAAIYYPDAPSPEMRPAVLYTCGHSSRGSWHFQAHPVLWARRGYVCLILDTLEQNDNRGEHHGADLHLHHHRIALGYGSCGGEVFNTIRALDVLAADPAVDAGRIGITGVSGGGAMSLFAAALDQRIRAVSTLCGLCSPWDAIGNRHLLSHCDCMFPLNLFQRDLADIAALVAPRAALFCFGENDAIFHTSECLAMVERARKVWKVCEADERFQVVTANGPHGDHPDFDLATQKWFDRNVAGEEHPIIERGEREIPKSVASIFQGKAPSPNRLHLLPELLNPRGSVALPTSLGDWAAGRSAALEPVAASFRQSPEARLAPDISWTDQNGVRVWHRGRIDGVAVFLDTWKPSRFGGSLILSTASGGKFARELQHTLAHVKASDLTAVVAFEPRLCGANYAGAPASEFPAGKRFGLNSWLAKALTIVGKSPVQYFVKDIQAAVNYLRTLKEFSDSRIILHGEGESAVAALMVAALDSSVAGVVLEDLPESFTDRVEIPRILRVLDVPELVGLIAPRRIAILNRGEANWSWPERAFQRLECPENLSFPVCLREGFSHALSGN